MREAGELGQARLLVVDDDVELCQSLSDIFGEKGYLVETAYNGAQAEEKLRETFFNVSLLDIKLPDIDGIELLRRLKKVHPNTEVILITGYASLESSIAALREGAFAYVIKPMAMDDVIATVEQAIDKQRLLLAKEKMLIQERWGKEYYRTLSNIDGLTELYNYRYFRELLTREIALAKRYSNYLSLLMIDIDNFKEYNDIHGHLAGDKALRQVARLLKTSCRSGDVVTRYGGEEFTVLMPYTKKEDAAIAAERLRGIIEKGQPRPWVEPWLTVSIGIANFPSDAQSEEELISRADQALYKAKGIKNTVCTLNSGS